MKKMQSNMHPNSLLRPKFRSGISMVIIIVLMIVPQLRAQDSTAIRKLKSFAQQYVNFAKTYPQEKVYLHFDNTSYYLGETIWFKAYVARADRNSLSPMSKILYVELLNQEGYVLQTKKYKITDGQCNGEFAINPSQYGGYYEVRAYTRYMLNFGNDNYFTRIFPVYDQPQKAGVFSKTISSRPVSQVIPSTRATEPHRPSLELSFFPEGGGLVQNIESRIAFKATNKNGENAVVTGAVYNDKKEKVADIDSEFEGMGVFLLKPTTEKYSAEVDYNGKSYSFALPAIAPKGHTLYIDNTDADKVTVAIEKNAETPSIPLALSVTCRGIMYVFEQINLEKENATTFSIAKKLLPTGVNQFTLFNSNGDIVAERLAFVNRNNRMNITVNQNKKQYEPYEKANLQFTLSDPYGKPVETRFSVAIRDGETSQQNPFANNILSDLLLSSEIKGYINNPGFYFQSNDNAHQQALDLLMLTQGWSNYSWQLMSGKKPFTLKHHMDKQLYIEGHVASIMMKRKMKNVDVSLLLMTDSTSQQGKCPTDSVGEFNFGLLDYTGSARLILQTKVDNKLKGTRIMLDRNFMPDPRAYFNSELLAVQQFVSPSDSSRAALLDSIQMGQKLSMSERDHLLKEVVVKEKSLPAKISLRYDVDKEMDKMEDTGDWQPTDIYSFLEKTNKYVSTTIDEQGNTTAKYKGRNLKIVVRTSKNSVSDAEESIGTDPATSSNHFVTTMPLIDEIESVSIVEDASSILRLSGRLDMDPTRTAICIIVRKSNYKPIVNGMRTTSFDGYAYVRQFYTPQYDRYRAPGEKDIRRTLYWNPNVQTNSQGQATISFPNNNKRTTKFNISAETVTQNGIIGAYNK
jgi:hypothetical protein